MGLTRKRRKLIAWLLIATGLFTFGPLVAYHQSRTLLCVDSGPVKAEAIVVLGGDPFGRPARAAELFAEGGGSQIIVSGNGDFAEVVRVLKARGVPAESVHVEGKSRNTKENAEFSVAMLRKAGITNAIVVTSWYHSRRALNCFRKAAPEMQFYSRPSYFGLDRAEWSRNGVGVHIRAEYVKLLGYWVRYGICPL